MVFTGNRRSSWWPQGRIFDAVWSAMRFRKRHGRWPRLAAPEFFNDVFFGNKVSFCQERDRVVPLVDKEFAKEWVMKRLGQAAANGLCARTYGILRKGDDLERFAEEVWQSADPGEGRYAAVLKPTHASARMALVPRAEFSSAGQFAHWMREMKVLNWLDLNFYKLHREPQYRWLEPKVIAEEKWRAPPGISGEREPVPDDYKFFCNDGVCCFVEVYTGRPHRMTIALMSCEWERLNVTVNLPEKDITPERPARLDEMLKISGELSKGLPPVRVDLFLTESGPMFSELTFTPGDCRVQYENRKHERLLGMSLVQKAPLTAARWHG
jgi:hypothetical protein